MGKTLIANFAPSLARQVEKLALSCATRPARPPLVRIERKQNLSLDFTRHPIRPGARLGDWTGGVIRFSSSSPAEVGVLTERLDALLPVLYRAGCHGRISRRALAALLGKDAPNMSPAVIARLTAEWQAVMTLGRH